MTDPTPLPPLALASRRVVLADRVVAATLRASGGLITAVEEDRIAPDALDLGDDLLVPGLVELHTDALEAHHTPRPKVVWDAASAVHAYDAQIAASGITTVFDSLRAGGDGDRRTTAEALTALGEALEAARAGGYLRAEHRTHLRCEVCSEDVLEEAGRFVARFGADLMSLMDHTPGQRQFRDEEKLLDYYRGKSVMSEDGLSAYMDRRRALHAANAGPHRAALIGIARARGVPVASHDDTTLEHVAESLRDGVALAEFPTTLEAARASHEGGLAVMMGAPNVVRGGSHSGNVAARELAEAGLLDVLSSDYVPASLVMGALMLADVPAVGGVAGAIRLVTLNPARATGLHDRGAIAPGLRADLARVATPAGGGAVVREVWREGRRVC